MKIIIWGYPLHTHTHSYIHESFFKAFKYLGYETYWFDDEHYPDNFDWNNCIFFTEGYADKKIPLRKSSTYYVHVCIKPEKYLNNVKKLIDVRYHQDKMTEDNYEFDHDITQFEQLDTGVCVDRIESKQMGYDICYIAWATDLLPHEFNEDWVNIKRENTYYFIGSISSSGRFANQHLIERFAQLCMNNGVNTVWSNPWTNPIDGDLMRQMMQKSFLSPDLRNATHVEWGTKTCRIFKSISYGQLGLTNSPKLAEFAGPLVICRENIDELFEEGLRFRGDTAKIIEQMRYIKDHHTYVNRINGILKLL